MSYKHVVLFLYSIFMSVSGVKGMNGDLDANILGKTYQINTANNTSFKVSIEQIKKFTTLYEMIQDCSDDTSQELELPYMQGNIFKYLLQIASSNKRLLNEWKLFFEPISLDDKVSILNGSNFLNMTPFEWQEAIILVIGSECEKAQTSQQASACINALLKINDDLAIGKELPMVDEKLSNLLVMKMLANTRNFSQVLYDQACDSEEISSFKLYDSFSKLSNKKKAYLRRKFFNCPEVTSWLALSANKNFLVARGSKEAELYVGQYDKLFCTKLFSSSPVLSASINSANNLLATISYDGIIAFWSLESNQLLAQWNTGLKKLHKIRFSADGSQLLLYSYFSFTVAKKVIDLIPPQEKEQLKKINWAQRSLLVYLLEDLINWQKHEATSELYNALPVNIRLMTEGKYGRGVSDICRDVIKYLWK